MAALVQDMSGSGLLGTRAASGYRAEVFTDLASVEAIWRGLETAPGAFGSPYQRYDWVAAYVEAVTGGDVDRIASMLRVFVLRDADHRCRALLPLSVARERGVRVARVIGEKHANFHMPLFASREAAAIRPYDLTDALVASGRAQDIDVFCFDYQPCLWDGMPNPLSAGGERCASDAYELMLGPDGEATVARAYSSDARRKMRAKERKLVEAFGPIEHRVADTPASVVGVLDVFYAQKQARMARMGAPDPYACAATRTFLTRAGASARPNAGPAIEIHALCVAATGRVLATFGGAVDADRFSGMWTSFDPDPEVTRLSPGDLLLRYLVAWQADQGRRGFDLGVGEAEYKSRVCDQTIELVRTVIPVTLRGRLYSLGLVAAQRLKSRIKRSPRLWAVAYRLRQRLAGIRPGT